MKYQRGLRAAVCAAGVCVAISAAGCSASFCGLQLGENKELAFSCGEEIPDVARSFEQSKGAESEAPPEQSKGAESEALPEQSRGAESEAPPEQSRGAESEAPSEQSKEQGKEALSGQPAGQERAELSGQSGGQEELASAEQSGNPDSDTQGGEGTDPGTFKSGAVTADGRVNINRAGVEELMSLKGIGETRAKAIIAYRTEHGVFTKAEDIMQVPGIKEGIFSKIQHQIAVD